MQENLRFSCHFMIFFSYQIPNFSLTQNLWFRVNSIVLIAIVIVLAIPIFGLTGFHMVLVSRGRTTNEQVTGKFKGGYNPFSRGCWHNCCYTQFGPQYPRSVTIERTWSNFNLKLFFQGEKLNLSNLYKRTIFSLSLIKVWWSHRNMLHAGHRRKTKRLARSQMKSRGILVIMLFSMQLFTK